MTGTVTATKEISGKYRKYVIDWLCNASGAFSATFAELGLGTSYGSIHFIETAPGANGDLTTELPTNAYDLTLKDAYACDIAGGNLADRSGTVAERYVPSTVVPVNDALTLAGANCGNAKQGRVIVVLLSK